MKKLYNKNFQNFFKNKIDYLGLKKIRKKFELFVPTKIIKGVLPHKNFIKF